MLLPNIDFIELCDASAGPGGDTPARKALSVGRVQVQKYPASLTSPAIATRIAFGGLNGPSGRKQDDGRIIAFRRDQASVLPRIVATTLRWIVPAFRM
jgi:hypothetical protein